MAAPPFIITEHVIDGQHVREYLHATRTGDDAVKLAVKRYTPKSNLDPQPGDVTIIGAHGSGFPKVRHSTHIVRLKEHLVDFLCGRKYMNRSGKKLFPG
jgi:hypothetical protein